ncbi:MAG TPA: hypothetical protein PLG78_08100, partial [Leptospiraceae bacterium]|nr:hypothetical protein [Leptospiraceae bacterium]
IPSATGNTRRQIEMIQDFGVTAIHCTPSYALHLAEAAEEMDADLSSLKKGMFGAEPWSDAMRKDLEKKLGVDPGGRNLLRRFLHFGKVLLERAEQQYGVEVSPDKDFDYRIGRIRHTILDNIADRFNVKNFDRKADAIGKLRQLFALMEMISIGYPDPNLPKVTPEDLEWAHGECVKAFDFIVIKKDYLVSNPTPERFYEWLARFESYVYGKKPRALGGEPSPRARKAVVKFAKPFRLSEFAPKDKKAKKSALDELLKKLRREMQEMLDESQSLTRPLFKPGDIGGE